MPTCFDLQWRTPTPSRGLPEDQRCSRWCIRLMAVVRFDDLDVPIRPKHSSSPFHELRQQRNADRGIGSTQYSHALCCPFHPLGRGSIKSGRPDEDGHRRPDCPIQTALERVRRREINDHVGMILTQDEAWISFDSFSDGPSHPAVRCDEGEANGLQVGAHLTV